MKLFMLLLGCKPQGRKTEQHDIFFGIGKTLRELVPDIKGSWENAGKIHIDAWREINFVDGHEIKVIPNGQSVAKQEMNKLFFINLGGYKLNEFEEFHYKMLACCENKAIAIQQAKDTAFYRHTGFKEAVSHVDDKYGVDIDDMYEIEDILPQAVKERYSIQITPATHALEDELHLGYFVLDKL